MARDDTKPAWYTVTAKGLRGAPRKADTSDPWVAAFFIRTWRLDGDCSSIALGWDKNKEVVVFRRRASGPRTHTGRLAPNGWCRNGSCPFRLNPAFGDICLGCLTEDAIFA